MADFIKQIDWQRPWLAPLYQAATRILQAENWRNALNEEAVALGLKNHRGLPIHFVPQADLPAGTAYETFISETGGVPTRENLHDLFNALVWLTFPAIKTQLNALQAAEIQRAALASSAQSPGHARGRVRDGATIFDENAALLITHDVELVAALRSHQWGEVFLKRRSAFRHEWDVVLFGHALMEKLVAPYKAITAHVWVLQADPAFFVQPASERQKWIDVVVAAQLKEGLATSDFTPLPVLGIPGWWPNQDEDFYNDRTVFRPARRRVG